MCATSSDNALQKPDQVLPATDSSLGSPEALTRLCSELKPLQGVEALVEAVNRLIPDLQFSAVLSRGGWHRLGGVVDGDYRRVAGNIAHWVEQQSEGDFEGLIARYGDSGYFATRLSGKTHFITAPRGESPQDFIQIEIEELRETLDRPLIASDWYPNSVEEFLDPLDCSRVKAEPVGEAYYQFRRITSIGDLLDSAPSSRKIDNLRRLFADWSASSAGEHAAFCDHWVLALSEYRDREGLPQITVKPITTYSGEIPGLPQGQDTRGAALANAIHSYDRQLGYLFAWYFMMLGQKAGNLALANAVLADQMGAYEYLPKRDLKVLREWESRPYGV